MYKVIIIEDDPMVASINKQYVELTSSFHVEATFKNGILAKKGREHHHDVVDLQRTGKDRSIIWILEEVEVHCVFVILSGKFQYRKGLAALTAALDDKRLPAGRVFPCKQLVCDLSP